jgi:hypothetical protein
MMMLAVMYGMIPSANDRQLQQRPAAEQVDELVQPALSAVRACVDAQSDGLVVHTRRRHERAEPEERHDRQREQQLASEVGVRNARTNAVSTQTSCAPPVQGRLVVACTAPVRQHRHDRRP